ncbi:hypothetical protein R3P38DRAFT_2476375, partial [Favolaschia claudopus]
RKPRAGNKLTPSVFRPHVPADRRLLLWTTPHSFTAHAEFEGIEAPLNLQVRFFENMLQAHAPDTREAYGAVLLRFAQFCDRLNV